MSVGGFVGPLPTSFKIINKIFKGILTCCMLTYNAMWHYIIDDIDTVDDLDDNDVDDVDNLDGVDSVDVIDEWMNEFI